MNGKWDSYERYTPRRLAQSPLGSVIVREVCPIRPTGVEDVLTYFAGRRSPVPHADVEQACDIFERPCVMCLSVARTLAATVRRGSGGESVARTPSGRLAPTESLAEFGKAILLPRCSAGW